MPKIKLQKPTYPEMKKRLQAMGLRKGPMFSKHNKPRPSIPKMHPTIKGSVASNYRRIGRPVRTMIHNSPKVIVEKVPVTDLRENGLTIGDAIKGYKTVTRQIPTGFKTEIKYSIRRNSKKGGGGKGGGGQRISHITGSATARRTARTKIAGTRGARPRKEKRKQKRQ